MSDAQLDNRMLEAALEYHARGWSVFPVEPGEKKPVILSTDPIRRFGWRPYTKRLPTERQINNWWGQWPDANIALVLGVGSGAVALDYDGDGAKELAEDNGLHTPPTSMSRTGRGGLHVIYSCDEDLPTTTTLLKGDECHIEFRATGAYILLPPSVTEDEYRWLDGLGPEALAPLPSAIRELVNDPGDEGDGFAFSTRISKQLKQTIAEDSTANTLFSEPADEDQSARDFALACRLIELGIAREEIAAVVWQMPHGKRRRDQRGSDYVVRTVERAYKLVGEEKQHGREQGVQMPMYHATDWGNAQRLVWLYGKHIRWVPLWKRWLRWNGAQWLPDQGELVERAAKQTVHAMQRQAAELDDSKDREELGKWAFKCESRTRLSGMVELTRSEVGIPITPKALDADPWVLNVQNGLLHLSRYPIRFETPAPREALCTKIAATEYDPRAECPRWSSFLREVFRGDEELIQYVQRAVGYCLTGDVIEHAVFFCYGDGENGKSTMLETIGALLGDYAVQANPNLLLRRYGGEPHLTELASLYRTRFATTLEPREGRAIDESRLKWLSGGDTINCRRMHEDEWNYEPTHKLWLGMNYKPRILTQDWATWRRLKLIPFMMKFSTDTDPPRDPKLKEKLRTEFPGILNWALEGLAQWQEGGLPEPAAVAAAIKEYRGDEDIISAFIGECCVQEVSARTPAADLYKAYYRYCQDSGENALSKMSFGQRLSKLNYPSERVGGQMIRRGLGLQDQEQFDWSEE